jgi:hypothetical protein
MLRRDREDGRGVGGRTSEDDSSLSLPKKEGDGRDRVVECDVEAMGAFLSSDRRLDECTSQAPFRTIVGRTHEAAFRHPEECPLELAFAYEIDSRWSAGHEPFGAVEIFGTPNFLAIFTQEDDAISLGAKRVAHHL